MRLIGGNGEMAVHFGAEGLELDWLLDVPIATCGREALDFVGHGLRGHGHNGDIVGPGEASQSPEDLETVNVEEPDIHAYPVWPACARHLDGSRAPSRSSYFISRRDKDLLGELEIHLVVVDEENGVTHLPPAPPGFSTRWTSCTSCRAGVAPLS